MDKVKRLLSYYKPHRGLLTLDLSCALTTACIDLAYPLFSRYVLSTLLPAMAINAALLNTFLLLMAGALAVYVLRTLLLYVVGYYGHVLGVHIEADMRRDIFTHIQSLQFSFFDTQRTGKLMSRVTTDLFDITELSHHGPEDILISGTTVVGAFICMFFVEWRLALAMLCIMVPAVWFVTRLRLRMLRSSLLVKENMAEINASIESSISGARVAKAFANEQHEIEVFAEGNRRFIHAKDAYYQTMATFNSGVELVIGLLNVAVLGVGGFLIYQSRLDTVALITFTLYVAAFAAPIKRLALFAEIYMMGMAGFSRFCEIMDIQPDIVDAPGATPLTNVAGHIRFEDVSFAYGNGRTVLSHVNLDIPAGRTVALVGPSGGGKTTLCHLIPRFYETRSGRITVDGHDIKDVTLRSLRNCVGIVQQDVFLFAGSVMENIRYGRIDATDDEVVAAAIRAHIHEEVLRLPDGYNTAVGERGMMLSGGQKQRVAIARLFLKNPPILILDEATSALDTVTEQEIQQAFDELARGRTTLVIAHRLSTVRHADEIIVLDEHGIRERGTHEALLGAGGVYAELYAATLKD